MPPRWRRNDVRGQILTSCVQSPSVAEIASRLSLPLGATRFLVDDLVTQGYLRVRAPLGDSMTIDERRELISRTLRGLRASVGSARQLAHCFVELAQLRLELSTAHDR